MVAIDGKFAASVPAGKAGSISLAPGRYTVMAADSAGTYWEQETGVAQGQLTPLIVSFDAARKEHEAAKREIASLQDEVAEKKDNLQEIQQRNETLKKNPRLIQDLRESIVRQMRRDADRRAWEKLQAADKSERSGEMMLQATLGNLANQGKGDLGASISQIGNFALTVAATRLQSQATRHQLASDAAVRRLDRLATMVKDPLAATQSLSMPDYAATFHTLSSGKGIGQLVLSDEVIEYRKLSAKKSKAGVPFRLTCSGIKGVDISGKQVTVKYKNGTLKLKTDGNVTPQAIAGDIYLACPAMTGGTALAVRGSSPAAAKGARGPVPNSSGCYESTVTGPTIFRGNGGETFKLSDGTLWVVKYGYSFLTEFSPEVLACPEEGKIIVGGKTIEVERLLGCQESSIASPTPFRGNDGEILKLRDGTLWEVRHGNAYLSEYNPTIIACPGEGKLRVSGKTIDIRQVSGCQESSILGPRPFEGNNGETFKLADGTLWEVKFGNAYLSEFNPKVLLCPDQGRLKVAGKTLDVQQISGCYESSIASPTIFRGDTGETLTLSDGSQWKVLYGSAFLSEVTPRVVVCPDAGQLKVAGKTLNVRQISGAPL